MRIALPIVGTTLFASARAVSFAAIELGIGKAFQAGFADESIAPAVEIERNSVAILIGNTLCSLHTSSNLLYQKRREAKA